MHFITTKKICDVCYENGKTEPIECSEMSDTMGLNLIAWYACGHVYIIDNGTVVQTYDYNHSR